ncbi:DNA replication protein DciA [Microlunatus ginsengisoli]|uniref:DNA replication protein DciA n=1 Tax=Microlunatus ginsengisoli TaxID=363863 RepID=A0ABP6ZZ45_9ACTN
MNPDGIGRDGAGSDGAGSDGTGPAGPDDAPHDPGGLGLARSIAKSTGRPRRRRRTGPPPVSEPQASGAHPDDRDPKTLGSALDRLVESKGWSTEVSVHALLGRWPALVGPELAAHSRPERYTDTVLTVRTDSTAWASQLRLLAPQLVATLNRQLGDGTVTRVSVLGPDAPSWKKGRLSVRDGRGPRDTYG